MSSYQGVGERGERKAPPFSSGMLDHAHERFVRGLGSNGRAKRGESRGEADHEKTHHRR
jgi:hypothetical protein